MDARRARRRAAPDLRGLVPMTDMLAAVLHGVGDLRVESKPVPTPGPGEVLVRISACGVCGSDATEFGRHRSEEHTSELQSLMRISYAVFCWKKKTDPTT